CRFLSRAKIRGFAEPTWRQHLCLTIRCNRQIRVSPTRAASVWRASLKPPIRATRQATRAASAWRASLNLRRVDSVNARSSRDPRCSTEGDEGPRERASDPTPHAFLTLPAMSSARPTIAPHAAHAERPPSHGPGCGHAGAARQHRAREALASTGRKIALVTDGYVACAQWHRSAKHFLAVSVACVCTG